MFPSLAHFATGCSSLLSSSDILNCCFRLCVSHQFFGSFVPRVISFCSRARRVASVGRRVTAICVEGFRACVPFRGCLARRCCCKSCAGVGACLMGHCRVPLSLGTRVVGPKVGRVRCKGVRRILSSLRKCLDVARSTMGSLGMFPLSGLLTSLRRCTVRFLSLWGETYRDFRTPFFYVRCGAGPTCVFFMLRLYVFSCGEQFRVSGCSLSLHFQVLPRVIWILSIRRPPYVLSMIFSLLYVRCGGLLPTVPRPGEGDSGLLLFPLYTADGVRLSAAVARRVALYVVAPIYVYRLRVRVRRVLRFLFYSLMTKVYVQGFLFFRSRLRG